mgnify:CR=1 FL=1
MNFKYWIALTAVVGLLTGYAYHRDLLGAWKKLEDSRRDTVLLREQEGNLKAQRDELKKSVDALGSDPVEMEASIRRNKKLVREGEKVYRVELPPK